MHISNANQQLEALSADWLEAKQSETESRDRRIAAEVAMLAILPQVEEGSYSQVLQNGIKISTRSSIIYTADFEMLEEITKDWPESLIKTKREINTSVLRDIRKQRPLAYARISDVVTSKPAKTTVTVVQGDSLDV